MEELPFVEMTTFLKQSSLIASFIWLSSRAELQPFSPWTSMPIVSPSYGPRRPSLWLSPVVVRYSLIYCSIRRPLETVFSEYFVLQVLMA